MYQPVHVTLETLCQTLVDRFIMQPSCFFTRRAWQECGPLDENLHFAMDTDLWFRIAQKFSFAMTLKNLSTSVVHPDAKTTARAAESYADGFLVVLKYMGQRIARDQLIAIFEKLLVAKEREVAAIRSSLSWKVTSPLRAFHRRLKH